MFVRCKKRFKDGKEHRYWSVVENVRVSGGRVVQRQVLYLGEINDSQRAAWCRSIEVLEGAGMIIERPEHNSISAVMRAVLRHPMLLGLLLWAIAHLLSNGDLRSVVLFGGFAGFAVLDLVSAVARDQRLSTDKAPRLAMDAVAIVAGLAAAGLLAVFHAALFGVPVT